MSGHCRYPNNVSVIRLYATFLTGVKCAPGRALRMFNKADALEDAQSDVKQGAFVGETLEGNRGVTMAGPQDGVIVINDTGTVQFANRNLNRLFG